MLLLRAALHRFDLQVSWWKNHWNWKKKYSFSYQSILKDFKTSRKSWQTKNQITIIRTLSSPRRMRTDPKRRCRCRCGHRCCCRCHRCQQCWRRGCCRKRDCRHWLPCLQLGPVLPVSKIWCFASHPSGRNPENGRDQILQRSVAEPLSFKPKVPNTYNLKILP